VAGRGCCAVVLFAAAVALLSIGCGGGGSSGAPPPPPPPPPQPQPLSITTTTLPDGLINRTYSAIILQATGGTGQKQWSLSSGNLPPGITLQSNGELSGSPTSTGNFNFVVQVQDSANPPQTASKALLIRVADFLSVSPNVIPLRSGRLGFPYSAQISVMGGIAPYTWTLVSGSLLPGLSLNSQSGEITGVPTGSGPVQLTILIVDSGNPPQSLRQPFTLGVSTPLMLTGGFLPRGKLGRPYSGLLGFSGGAQPIRFGIAAGSLPPGLSLLPGSNQIAGGPTMKGIFSFTIEARDNSSPEQVVQLNLQIPVDGLLISSSLSPPTAVINEPYSHGLQATGGVPPFTWSIAPCTLFCSGIPRLPAGLSQDPTTGTVSGTPTESGSFSFEVKVQDSDSPQGVDTQLRLVSVNPLPFFFTTSLPDGVVGRAYNEGVFVAGGRPPVALNLESGTLPPGISLTNGNRLEGTPTMSGTFTFTVRFQDSSSPPYTGTQSFSVRTNQPLDITTSSLPQGQVGQPYSFTLQTTGGAPPYNWSSGNNPPLPNGLAIDPATGTLAGTPLQSVSGAVFFDFFVMDSANPPQTASKRIPLPIPEALFILTSRLPAATVGSQYSVTLQSVGRVTPLLKWSLTSGVPPDGLLLDPGSGKISGMATTEGTRTVTVQVEDQGTPGLMASRSLTLETRATAGRNDSIATATPISSGSFVASISPLEDNGGVAQGDVDYYELSALGGTLVVVEIFSDRLTPPSPLDSVIEIVDASGNRFASCWSTFATGPPASFACVNDDGFTSISFDSRLNFLVPGPPTTPVKFYVRVLDFRGLARPDFLYELRISGAM